MATAKKDLGASAHFRIDEIERSVQAALESITPEHVQALVAPHVLQVMQAQEASINERLAAAQLRTEECFQRLAEALTAYVQACAMPRTKTGTIDLPGGPVRVSLQDKMQ